MNKQNRIEKQFCDLTGFASEYIKLAITKIHFRRGTRRPELLRGFSLIELLVVISIIFLLASISIPTLQRARHQARAVVCQSNLRQWGFALSLYIDDYNGKLWPPHEPLTGERYWWFRKLRPYFGRYGQSENLLLCPMSTKSLWSYYEIQSAGEVWGTICGDKYSAWSFWSDAESGGEPTHIGSYGYNHFLKAEPSPRNRPPFYAFSSQWYWGSWNVKKPGAVPVLSGSAWPETAHGWPELPPDRWDGCVNRHDGFVNSLFMDWSVRKVGLKELWTLKWHREFDTAGPWTKAGGVRPQDWPKWMRRFKDY